LAFSLDFEISDFISGLEILDELEQDISNKKINKDVIFLDKV